MRNSIRRAAKIDNSQNDIVKALMQLPNLTVEVGHDDILVGYQGKTYWIELKSPEVANKAGKVFPSSIKKSQHELLRSWRGHYAICTTFDEVLKEINYA